MKNTQLTTNEIKALIRLVQNEQVKGSFVDQLKEIEAKLIAMVKEG